MDRAMTDASPEGLPPEDELMARFGKWDQALESHWGDWRKETKESYDFYAGRQWSDDESRELKEAKRAEVTINRVATIIDAVSGAEILGRQQAAYYPREVGDSAVNEVLTKGAEWVRDQTDADFEESEAARDSFICGMGWCLSDDAMVRIPNAHFATTRLYSGAVIDIDLEHGQKLTGTPNHPVLTDRGWKRLCALEEGDNLIRSAFLERIEGFPVEQFDKVEARLKDKIDAFRAGREALRLRTAPNDFYSDGRGSEVHVVYADGALLRKVRHAARLKHLNQALLAGRQLLARVRVALLRERLLTGAIFVPECQPALCVAHAPSAHSAGSDIFAKLVARASQANANGLARQSDRRPDFFGGQRIVEVQASKFLKRHLRPGAAPSLPQRVAGPEQSGGHCAPRYSNLISDFVDWKPALEIEAREFFRGDRISAEFVTRVTRRVVREVNDFPVHDVGTSLGMFIAGDVITSNTETRMDYEEEATGKIVVERVDPLEMAADPAHRKPCCLDARYIRRKKPISDDDFERLFPDKLPGRSPDEARVREINRKERYEKGDTDTPAADEVIVCEWQWYDVEPNGLALAEDPQTGGTREVAPEQAEALELSGLKVVRVPKRCYWRAFTSGENLLRVEKLPDGEFTYKALTGKRDRNKRTWFGLMRLMRDPQKWANSFFVQILHIIQTTTKGGVYAEAGSIDDVRQFEESLVKTDKITWLPDGTLSQGRVQQKPTTPYPQGLDRLMEVAISSIRDATGVNQELLGLVEREQAGVLEDQRKQAAYGILAAFFDSLRRYRRAQGRHVLKLMRYLPPDTLVRIVGDDGTSRYVPLAMDPETAKFDVVVDEAPSGPRQKERVWNAAMQMTPILKDLGPEEWSVLLDYSPFPAAIVQRFKKVLEQRSQEPPDPMAERGKQASVAEQEGKARKVNAEADEKELGVAFEAQQMQALSTAFGATPPVLAGGPMMPAPEPQQAF